MAAVERFHYRLARPGYTAFPGAHPGQATGSGQLFKRHEPLLASPDPRRIDLRASVLDPFNAYRVRVYQQHSRLQVFVVADLSASMQSKLPMVSDFIESAAHSVIENGDAFGFMGCETGLSQRWCVPSGLHLHAFRHLAHDLRTFRAHSTAAGLTQVAPWLPARRSLLFFVSDCHFPAEQLRDILHPLARHVVVPLVLWSEEESATLPDWGLVRFQDAEHHRSRTLWMRPSLKRRIEKAITDRQSELRQVFRGFGLEPLFMTGRYVAERLNTYFLQHAL